MTVTPRSPLVAVLAYDGLCAFEFAIAYEVFGLPRPEMGPGWYRYCPCAVEPGPLRSASGLVVEAAAGLEILAEADLIIIPGWRGIAAPVPGPLLEALRQAHARGAAIASLCSGAFVLGAAGLLDGRRATTHWRYFDAMADHFPAARLEPDVLYVEEDRILTAAGSAAGIDLCLHLVRRDFGAEVANRVARRLVVAPHREGGQAQFIERPVPKPREGARLSALMEWMQAHLDEDQKVPDLASRAGMSIRTFQRRFEETTGLPPGSWLLQLRLARARELLEAPEDRSLDDIAEATGFRTVAALRHHFRLRLGVSPGQYRDRFFRDRQPSRAA
ncbi:transcriptional regulator FtrA [Rhabdaerophilum sp. SD176]|uniref:transcriptional regulator FtrA n=1 Tax=Rhabdaerophilum sp. SD176 TaxID=2983548 RepID=UPI0024DFD3A9|nr:transcriptional regulator FtrA [Rhabdaerophilum sp. SD176]